jgi:hypothetical protein
MDCKTERNVVKNCYLMETSGKSTIENLISKSRTKFGDLFDFTDAVYVDSETKLAIRCIKHNEIIYIRSNNHLNQKYGGCKSCHKTDIDEIKLQEGEIAMKIREPNFTEFYLITNFGRGFALKTNTECKFILRNGYRYISLRNGDLHDQVLVHHLVYKAFNLDFVEEKGKVIDHIDGDKLNNRLENLRYITCSENGVNACKNNKNINPVYAVIAFDDVGNFVQEFESIKDATKFIGHSTSTHITSCLNQKQKTSGGYIWRYKDQAITDRKVDRYIDDISNYIVLDEDYIMNVEGDVLFKKHKRRVRPYTNEDGYIVTKLRKDRYLVHRLIGKYFLENGKVYFSQLKVYEINHKDKDRKNNSLDNLEWVLKRDNAVHAVGRKVAKLDKVTKEVIKEYACISDACIDLGMHPTKSRFAISRVCKGNSKRENAYGFGWKYI